MSRYMWLGLVLAGQAVLAQPGPTFVVAPGGDDAGPGTSARPFASLTRARDAVRALRAAEPDRRIPVHVALRPGWYTLSEPLALTAADSGTATSPTIWGASSRQSTVVSGGRRLTGWTVANGRWTLQLPADQPEFTMLFVNSQPRYRPRLPREGYYTIASELPATPANADRGDDRFTFRPGELDPNWRNLGDVEVLAFNEWNMARLRIAEVDAANNAVTFTGPTTHTSYWAKLRSGYRYLVENVAEALSEQGQWYLDRPTRTLTYIPMPGETPDQTVVVAPALDQLLTIDADVTAGPPVEHVHFDGLTFAHSNWYTPDVGHHTPQAESNLLAAVEIRGGQRLRFYNCSFVHLSTYALNLAEGCRENTIERCVFSDLGAGGIKIGTTYIPADERQHSGWTTIRDCTISHGGRFHPAGIGVWIAHSPNNIIEHNDIYDFYYTGISVGWTWGYGPSLAVHNRIADNRVRLIGQRVLSDMGGIYTLGRSLGSVIEHNLFADIDAFSYGGWGIYFDEGTTDIVARNNLVYRTKTGGFHQHYGMNNQFSNNILAFAQVGQLQRTRVEEHHQFTIENCLIYYANSQATHGNWAEPNRYTLRNNLWWDATGDPVRPGGMDWDAWQATGEDAGSIVADPLFADPERGDFTLPANSPAFDVGFVPFPLEGWGRRDGGGAWALREMPSAFPIPAPPGPPEPIAINLEDGVVGVRPAGFQVYEDANVTTATCRITDEQPASGTRCLKLTDAPGQAQPWNPHCVLTPGFTDGPLEGSFALRLGPGAQFMHEWRDTTVNPYRTLVSLTINDGQVRAGDRELGTVPANEWLRVRITGAAGREQDGTWALEITTPDGRRQAWTDLQGNPDFRRLEWFGFTSHATEATEIWLDNIAVGPVEEA